MTTLPLATGELDDACEKMLTAFDMYTSPNALGHLADVYTVDGDHCFTVTKAISQPDLRTLITYGRACRAAGEQAGREAVSASLRSLIGAAKAA